MIYIKDLTYSVGDTTILSNISIDIHNGEKIALIGPSGAGKSSFLNILSKKVTQYHGDVHINDRNIQHITNNKVYAGEVGMLTQNSDLIENLSVRSNVLMGQLRHWNLGQSLVNIFSNKQDIHNILSSVDLQFSDKKKVSFLSGGEKQRVGIARLINQNPNIVLADEPVASLDPTLSERILTLFLKVTKQKTLIVSLHQKELALKYFDRIIAIKNGQIFFDKNKSDITEALLDQLYERSL